MVEEGTPGKYSLRAVQPGSRSPLIEKYATRGEVAVRRLALENDGYVVLVTLPDVGVRLQRTG